MNEYVEPKPEPPKVGAYVACILELGMVAVFVYYQSFVGLILWLLYFHFSATRALVADMFIK